MKFQIQLVRITDHDRVEKNAVFIGYSFHKIASFFLVFPLFLLSFPCII